jgi:ring-1,2-phenylacetyl-CoA epoxidase subunit PaaD
MVTRTAPLDLHRAWEIAAGVVDPEIPVLTISDLGILRDVRAEGGRIVVTITPTYSGCPAMAQIEEDVVAAFGGQGLTDVEVRLTHAPAWSTDWISAEGREKLARFGIAPPSPITEVRCPRCDAGAPAMIARFGSTACKALMVCASCAEPFDHFKAF